METTLQARSELVVQTAARLAAELRGKLGDRVQTVRLFGSHARGEADEASDVDVAVVLDRLDWETQRQVLDLAADLSLVHGLTLSPTIFDAATYARWLRQERALVLAIEREGVAL